MTKIKLCGLRRSEDILVANELKPDYIGFVFAKKSRRYVSPSEAYRLKSMLAPGIEAVGVFVDESVDTVYEYLSRGIIDIAQLHGHEDDDYIRKLKALTDKPVIKALKVESKEDIEVANQSVADMVLLDGGAGDGKTWEWSLIKCIKRPYFLAGGLDESNIEEAVNVLKPYAVDVSSGIETDGVKDPDKMKRFVEKVRKVG
ncbi:MAG: phosphoribosylanthranilate isomerase [Lachnospiraceae bacterium]|nr:phosphoribosylanthranilate isomerase [Lachnospiraceae bacterium]